MKTKFDLDKYKRIRESVEYLKMVDTLKESDKLDYDKISQMCATSSLNLVAVYTFLSEDVPKFKNEFETKVKNLKDFYGYI